MIRLFINRSENALWMGIWSVLVEDFYGSLVLSSRNLIWSSWILVCPCLMATTGVRKFARFPGPHHVSVFEIGYGYRHGNQYGSGWLCDQAFWPAGPLPRFRACWPFLWVWADESFEYAGVILNTKSMDLHYQGSLEFDQEWVSNFTRFFEHAGILWRVMTSCENSGIVTFFIDDNTLSVNVGSFA